MIPLFVATPKGSRHHGDIIENTFVRKVKKSKDLMRIFDAWSIHPDALEQLKKEKIENITYIDLEEKKEYKTTVSNFELYGFLRSFAGGPTLYLSRKNWGDLPPRIATPAPVIKEKKEQAPTTLPLFD